MVAYNEVTGTAQSNIRLEVVIMRYPQTGNEVFVSFSLSNTMFSGIGKGTITREEVSADYLKALFSKYGVIVSASRNSAVFWSGSMPCMIWSWKFRTL